MTFLAPVWFLALVPSALVLMVIHRLRRPEPPTVVSNLFLWMDAAQPVRGAFIPRVHRRWDLLLQLLILVLVGTVLAQPVTSWFGPPGAVTVVVDVSASMGVIEQTGSRLDLARETIAGILGSFPSNTRVLLVAAGPEPVRVGEYDRIDSRLTSALDGLEVVDRVADIDGAVTMVLADNAFAGAPLILVSDLAGDARVPPGIANISVYRVGARRDNVGIVGFHVRSVETSVHDSEVFVEVANFGDVTRDVELSITEDGVEIGSADLLLEPGVRRIEIVPLGTGARIEGHIDVDDALARDNVAYGVNPPGGRLSVLLVTSGNVYLEAALSTHPRFDVTTLSPGAYDDRTPAYDVVVCDRCAAVSPAYRGVVELSPDPGPVLEGDIFAVDADPAWTGGVDLDALRSLRFVPLDRSPARRSVFEAGGVTVVDAEEAASRIRRVRVGIEVDAAFGRSRAFPVMIANAVAWAGHWDGGSGSLLRGIEPVRVRTPPGLAAPEIVFPDGSVRALDGSSGTVLVDGATRSGFYQVRYGEGGELLAVSLADAAESDIAPGEAGVGSVPGRMALESSGGVDLSTAVLGLTVLLLALELWMFGALRFDRFGRGRGVAR